jgi:hypothetical protein
MEALRHIAEPSRLLMTWQPADESVFPRTRRIVGEVRPVMDGSGEWTFQYFSDTRDVIAAKDLGFQGHPAFRMDGRIHQQGVRETLLRRLPPRSREDFSDFLAMHRLPFPFSGSDLALIGYTGARLPSDGFSFVPDFPLNQDPCEYILEVAGVRHNFVGDIANVQIGDEVSFSYDRSNEVDGNAIFVNSNGQRLGYVNRAMLGVFNYWLSSGSIRGTIERKNGKPDRPMIYVRLQANVMETSDMI